MTNEQIKIACELIAKNDRNSDIMDCLAEWQKGELPKEVLCEIIERELNQIESDSNLFEERFEWNCSECGKKIDTRYRDEYEEVDGDFVCADCYSEMTE